MVATNFIVSPIAGVASGNTLSFTDIQSAISYAQQNNISNINIEVAPGVYPNTITIPPNMIVVVKGSISGSTLLGAVVFEASGNFQPFSNPGTACSFNDVGINGNITLVDYMGVPAVAAVFITQNSTVIGNIVQTGTSNIIMEFAGIGSAYQKLTGFVNSSQVLGYIQTPHTTITSTNTVFDGYVDCAQFYASGCQTLSWINCTVNGAEFHNSLVDGYVSSNNIIMDATSYYEAVSNGVGFSMVPSILTAPRNLSIVISGDHTLSLLEASATTLTLSGTIPASTNYTITFPTYSFYNIDSTQITILGNGAHKGTLTLAYGSSTTTISNALYKVSINATGVYTG